ncbi:DNA-binding protein [Duganella radicis]|uniref:DNA-binding protein n=1 Tax=Duganella radicis TaxID=551988 RepID=A0A6L6PRH2_9BURK|nr:DNA-binding protein [Duganella radicis]MTV41680.1 DNA-binding protein [Duganella radicis]
MYRTAAEVIKEFGLRGISAAEWARRNGFSPTMVYQVLRSPNIPNRGQSHRIAVALGMKEGHADHDFDLKITQMTE